MMRGFWWEPSPSCCWKGCMFKEDADWLNISSILTCLCSFWLVFSDVSFCPKLLLFFVHVVPMKWVSGLFVLNNSLIIDAFDPYLDMNECRALYLNFLVNGARRLFLRTTFFSHFVKTRPFSFCNDLSRSACAVFKWHSSVTKAWLLLVS